MPNTTKQGGKASGASSSKAKKPSVPDIGKKPQQKKPAKAAQTSSNVKKEVKKESEEKMSTAGRQKLAITFFAVGLLLFFVAVIKGESGWFAIHNFSFRIFGLCMYVLPVIFFYLAFVYAKNKSIGSAAANLTGGGLFTVFACMLVHIISKLGAITDAGEKYLSSVAVSQQIKDVWASEKPNFSGGTIGASLGGALARLLGQTGSVIILVVLIVVIVMFITGMTLGGVFRTVTKPVKKVNSMTNERFEQRAEKREQREQEEAEQREKKKFEPPVTDSEKQKKKSGKFEDEYVTDESTFKIRGDGEKAPVSGMNIPVVLVDKTAAAASAAAVIAKQAVAKTQETKPASDSAKPKPAKEQSAVHKNYRKPPLDCLEVRGSGVSQNSDAEINAVAQKLINTLESFGVKAKIVNICRGPSVTRYEIEPDIGIKISKITRLADDIALRLAASGVRIAAIPNKTAIGIEVPNRSRDTVGMRECIDSYAFKNSSSKLNVALGKDIAGNIICTDLSKMPHLLIAGTTGSGKSVCLNTMIISILYNASPEEVQIVLIDPKQVEFIVYNGIAHLEVPVVANPRKAAGALAWAVKEMESRYSRFSEKGVRDINGYNRLAEKYDNIPKMPRIVIFIDELSDLMMVAPTEVEDSICRLAQMARAAGMHLVVATQRPSSNVITGVIKANIPSRISLSVSSAIDSRVILDTSGAEKLLGNGDMLFMPIGESKAKRLQGCFISDAEVENVVDFIKQNSHVSYNEDVIQQIDSLAAATESPKKKGSTLIEDSEESSGPSADIIKALEVLIPAGKASTTYLQNKLGWGYPKAARTMNELEECGYIAPKEGNKERRVLITLQQFYEMNASNDGIKAPVSTSITEETPAEIPSFEDNNYDEPVEEEQVYEEPVYDEPVYEEPEESFEDETPEEPEIIDEEDFFDEPDEPDYPDEPDPDDEEYIDDSGDEKEVDDSDEPDDFDEDIPFVNYDDVLGYDEEEHPGSDEDFDFNSLD